MKTRHLSNKPKIKDLFNYFSMMKHISTASADDIPLLFKTIYFWLLFHFFQIILSGSNTELHPDDNHKVIISLSVSITSKLSLPTVYHEYCVFLLHKDVICMLRCIFVHTVTHLARMFQIYCKSTRPGCHDRSKLF